MKPTVSELVRGTTGAPDDERGIKEDLAWGRCRFA